MTYSKISYELDGDIAIISFDDAATMNACGLDTAQELLHAFEQAADNARTTILTGKGRGFCSGANLSGGADLMKQPDHLKMKPDSGRALEMLYNPLVQAMRTHPHPIVTAVNGAAAGVGCSLALMGDIVIASDKGYFLQAFRRIGLVPDGGSTYLLARALGKARAMEMTLLGDKLPAEEAMGWGLVNKVVTADALMDVAKDYAIRLSEGPTLALAMTRDLVWRAGEQTFDQALQNERMAQRTAGRSNDSREGIMAFLEKRTAKFTGS